MKTYNFPIRHPVKVQMQGYGHTLGAAQVENLVKAKKI